MKKNILWTSLFFLVVMYVFVMMSIGSFAAPYHGDEMDVKQPDNTVVKVKIWGDEFFQHVESMDGYTLCIDPVSKWICYATLNSGGSELVSTGIKYLGSFRSDIVLPNNQKLLKGIEIKQENILQSADNKRKQLFASGDDAALKPTRATVGNVNGLTLLINFPDNTSSISKQEIDDMINKVGYTGFGNNGSVRDFFYDVSGGKLTYTNYVTAFYTAKNPKTYYNDQNITQGIRATELMLEALQYLDQQGFDFSTLTTSGGKALAVNCLYAGNPDVPWAKGLWPHSGSLRTPFSADGITISRYQMTSIGSSLQIGTFCHENGHMVCRYPDLYDYNYQSKGVGKFCLMCANGSTNPVPPCAYLRNVISGWGSITDLNNLPNNSKVTVTSNAVGAYQYKSAAANEFFMVESIVKKGRYATSPAQGLVVWHVDTNGSNNNPQMTASSHYLVSLEQADGRFDMEKNVNNGDTTDLFYTGYVDKFNDTTLPNSKWWNGSSSGLSIASISQPGDSMTFTVFNGNAGPTFTPTATFTPTNTPTPTYTSTPTQIPGFKVSGYVKPDFDFSDSIVNAGFKVEITELGKYAVTDNMGYFEIDGITYNANGYTLKITKPGYLTRTIVNASVTGNLTVGTQNVPVDMWVGDLGVQDNVINMSDIMEIAKGFNSIKGSANYKDDYDINKDGSINMADIMIIVKHLNKVSADYPPINIITVTPTPVPTATALITNTPTPTSSGAYPNWDSNAHAYAIGDKVSYQGNNYECIMAHTSNVAWMPNDTINILWKLI